MADPKLPGIYAIRNTANGKLYVGSAISIARRWQVHRSNLKTGVHRCKPLQRAYDKYGVAAFVYEVLEFVPDIADLISREQHWLDTLGSHCDHGGYNVCPTAESRLGMKMSAEARAKIGRAHKGRKATDEARANIAKGWLTRAPASAETRAKISAVHKGTKRSPEHRAKISAANRGRKLTDAQKAKISAVHKGKTISQAQRDAVRQAHLGKPRSPETIAKMLATRAAKPLSPENRARIVALGKANKGRIHSLEDRAKMSAAQRQRPPASDVTREKLRRWNLGRKMSPESIAKTRAANIGRLTSAETKAKLSAAQRNRPPTTAATRAKLSIALKGRKFSPETLERMSAAQRRRYGSQTNADQRQLSLL
jgi:group I intron endonuclease